MKHRLVVNSLPLLALFLALSPTAVASTKWYVDGVHGNDNNDCKSPQTACKTIGHAISLASSGDSIMVAAATYAENLTIRFSLKVIGSAASTTIIDGGGVNTVVAISSANAHVTLSRVTIRNGFSNHRGGGVNNSGTLTINNSTLSGNSARHSGGGIYNSGLLTINNSTLSGNSVNKGPMPVNNGSVNRNAAFVLGKYVTVKGGGISNDGGTLTINNSTLSRNSVDAHPYLGSAGGGIYSSGLLTINNSTLSGNSASGFYNNGGGISDNSGSTAKVQNSIVANTLSGGNCFGTMTSNGYNLSSDDTCNFNNTGDLNNTDPKLGKLGYHGGPTRTIPLLPGSPAIDAGNPSGCTDGQSHLLKTDQRGKPRPDKEDTGGCDMGAYERQKD